MLLDCYQPKTCFHDAENFEFCTFDPAVFLFKQTLLLQKKVKKNNRLSNNLSSTIILPPYFLSRPLIINFSVPRQESKKPYRNWTAVHIKKRYNWFRLVWLVGCISWNFIFERMCSISNSWFLRNINFKKILKLYPVISKRICTSIFLLSTSIFVTLHYGSYIYISSKSVATFCIF